MSYVGKKVNKYQTCNDNYFLKMSKVVRRVVLPLLLVSIACKGEEADRPVTVFLYTDSQATLVRISVINRLDLPSEYGCKGICLIARLCWPECEGDFCIRSLTIRFIKDYKETIDVRNCVVNY